MTHSAENQASHANLSLGHDAQATSGLYKNDISKSEKLKVKLSEFRGAYDALFRLVNVDYHACVGEKELNYFLERLKSRYRSVINFECKRASEYDQKQFTSALSAAVDCYLKIERRIKLERELGRGEDYGRKRPL